MRFILLLTCLFLTHTAFSAENIIGFWTTIDDETNEPKSIVRIYEAEGFLYGRVVKLFRNSDKTATHVQGNPKIEGLDIIWQMSDTDNKWTGGKILDPAKGKQYTCEIWKEGNNLIVRGKIGPFGRNQTWIPATQTENLSKDSLVPHIPTLK